MLAGIEPRDPATFAFVALLFAAIAAAATGVPALRAARTDPLEALRSE
jgi:ABC-type lipoprotein release transport system permease subunit